MQLIPYLSFDGQAREAFDFYREVLGGEITFRMTYGESPMAAEMPSGSHDRVMHSALETAGAVLMGADAPAHCERSHAGSCVSIHLEEPAEAERIFAALSAGGSIEMPIQETFWSKRFGMLTDRYGKPWMVNCKQPQQ